MSREDASFRKDDSQKAAQIEASSTHDVGKSGFVDEEDGEDDCLVRMSQPRRIE
jgi:hypothetical protein